MGIGSPPPIRHRRDGRQQSALRRTRRRLLPLRRTPGWRRQGTRRSPRGSCGRSRHRRLSRLLPPPDGERGRAPDFGARGSDRRQRPASHASLGRALRNSVRLQTIPAARTARPPGAAPAPRSTGHPSPFLRGAGPDRHPRPMAPCRPERSRRSHRTRFHRSLGPARRPSRRFGGRGGPALRLLRGRLRPVRHRRQSSGAQRDQPTLPLPPFRPRLPARGIRPHRGARRMEFCPPLA